MISVHDVGYAGASGDLARFRREFYRCPTRWADALFDLADAVLCGDGPVRSLAELSLAAEHRRGHGSLYARIRALCDRLGELEPAAAADLRPPEVGARFSAYGNLSRRAED